MRSGRDSYTARELVNVISDQRPGQFLSWVFNDKRTKVKNSFPGTSRSNDYEISRIKEIFEKVLEMSESNPANLSVARITELLNKI